MQSTKKKNRSKLSSLAVAAPPHKAICTRLLPAMEGQQPNDLDAPAMDAPLTQDVATGAMASALGALAAPIPSLAATDPGLGAPDSMAMDCANPHRRPLRSP